MFKESNTWDPLEPFSFSLPFDREVWSVSQLTSRIKEILEGHFPGVWIQGEISNFRQPASGHMYFTLKDESSQINGVMFRSANRVLRFMPEDGLSVLAFGRVSVYERRGEYQINVEYLEPKGIGALQLAYEKLKERLAREGLFDPAHKKLLPVLPRKVGVITSPTGAAIRDILQVIHRRFINLEIILCPVQVQGETAAGEIATAIEEMNNWEGVEVLIVGRGGGSIEDLWAFNEEIVARAIFASRIPIVSAVGHETDYTIADFVADVRAPTPSAAAEMVVSRKDQLRQRVDELVGRMLGFLRLRLQGNLSLLSQMKGKLHAFGPQATLRLQKSRLDALEERLNRSVEGDLRKKRELLQVAMGKLGAMNPLAVLERGYSLCTDLSTRRILRDADEVEIGDEVWVRLCRGRILCEIKGQES